MKNGTDLLKREEEIRITRYTLFSDSEEQFRSIAQTITELLQRSSAYQHLLISESSQPNGHRTYLLLEVWGNKAKYFQHKREHHAEYHALASRLESIAASVKDLGWCRKN